MCRSHFQDLSLKAHAWFQGDITQRDFVGPSVSFWSLLIIPSPFILSQGGHVLERTSLFTPKPTGLLLIALQPVVKSCQFQKQEGRRICSTAWFIASHTQKTGLLGDGILDIKQIAYLIFSERPRRQDHRMREVTDGKGLWGYAIHQSGHCIIAPYSIFLVLYPDKSLSALKWARFLKCNAC